MEQTGKRALIAMSGGVDSSVAAFLMKERGFDVIGATMKLYDNALIGEPEESGCCSLADTDDARAVCNRLGINYYVFDFSADFEKQVIERFARAYEEGRTPNPCIDCNRYLKFERLMRRARELDRDLVVTGHYARTEYDSASGRHLLLKSKDSSKDQTYVLFSLTQDQLAHSFFPLGDMTKEETRRIAEEQGFVNASKRDSQDICFVPDGDYAGFLKRYRGTEYPPGDFVDKDGNVLGRHKGIVAYTIGQRKGLGLALPAPMYVIRKDVAGNRVILGYNGDLMTKRFRAADCNWIAVEKPFDGMRVEAKIRYSQKVSPAVIHPLEDGCCEVEFDEPQRAPTPGQAAVFYDDDTVVGGGTIV
ncbi:MAG: tRNA 2-thiouridine(34) synthase MnmA [Clostridia bacterium]|nr:tRNA 2-thiouridine(34) synthase MnmA [Clostridia bacterium]